MKSSETLDLLQKGTPCHGFKLLDTHPIPEMDCCLWLLEHTFSGAKLVYLDANSQEKSFSLSFRILPEDNTGVAHVIEHTILSGSEAYKVKNWGGDGLLCSFHGAFTTRDSAIYPVSSTIEKSFQEAVALYTDAVFSPLALKSDLMMRNEGWHYEYDAKTDQLSYSGIVYHEMQSALETKEFLLEMAQVQATFPQTGYAYNIGGDPLHIPDLTYQHFRDTYSRIYTPQNCLAYVYGDTKLEAILCTLNAYFSHTPKQYGEEQPHPPLPHCHTQPLVLEYPVQSLEPAAPQDVVGVSWRLSPHIPVAHGNILAALLQNTMSKLLHERGIDFPLTVQYNTDCIVPFLTASFQQVNHNHAAQLFSVLQETIELAAKRGFPPKSVQTAISSERFHSIEKPGFLPYGVHYSVQITTSWAHGESLWTRLESEPAFDALDEMNPGLYFASLVTCYCTTKETCAAYILKASDQIRQVRQAATAERLHAEWSSKSQAQREKLLHDTQMLHEYQTAPDSPQLLERLPKTKCSDLPLQVPVRTICPMQTSNGEVLFFGQTSPVIQTTLHYHLPSFQDPDTLLVLGVWRLLFGRLPTQSKSSEMVQEQLQELGTINAIRVSGAEHGISSALRLDIQFQAFPKQYRSIQALLQELLFQTDFSDGECIRTILEQYACEHPISSIDPADRVKAYHSVEGVAAQYFEGIEFLTFLDSLLSDFQRKISWLQQQLKHIAVTVFSSERLTVGISCGHNLFDFATKNLLFPSQICQGDLTFFPLAEPKEAISHSGSVQYIAYAGQAAPITAALLAGCALADQCAVHTIRDLGGAYSVNVQMDSLGNLLALSGRDPHLRNTISSIQHLPSDMMEASDEQVRIAIIQAASRLISPKSTGLFGYRTYNDYDIAAQRYFSGQTREDLQKLWEQLLHLTSQQVRDTAGILEELFSHNGYCALVSREHLPKNSHLFHKIWDNAEGA